MQKQFRMPLFVFVVGFVLLLIAAYMKISWDASTTWLLALGGTLKIVGAVWFIMQIIRKPKAMTE